MTSSTQLLALTLNGLGLFFCHPRVQPLGNHPSPSDPPKPVGNGTDPV